MSNLLAAGVIALSTAADYTRSMTRGMLLVGIESSLLRAVAAEAGKRVEQFAAAFIPNRLAEPAREQAEPAYEKSARIPLSWNPGSPLSSRTVVLAAENRLKHIDEAILICTPPAVRRPPEELVAAEIESLVSDHIKGWFFLVKELTALFQARKTGTLVLVLSEISPEGGKDEAADLIGPSVAASFRAFAQRMLTVNIAKPYQTLAFSSEGGDDAAFAAFIFKQMEEGGRRNSGKWHKFGRLNFFGR